MEIIITCAPTQSWINSTGEENLEGAVIAVERRGKQPDCSEKKEVKRQQGRDEKSWRERGDGAEGDLLTAAAEQTIINSQ